MRRILAAEFIGTFFLVLIGPGAAAVNVRTGGAVGVTGIALAFTLVIAAMVYGLGGVSAHINPAVSVTFAARGDLRPPDLPLYVVAQCLGATAAAMLIRGATGDAVVGAATVPAVPTAAAFLLEAVFSFALMLVILSTTNRSQAGGAVAIGLIVGGCALMGGPLTGASMNPARSLGPAIASGVWTAHWLYWIAPILGMLLASAAYSMIHGASMTIFLAPSLEAVRELITASDLPAGDLESPGIEFLAAGTRHAVNGVVGLEAYGDVGLLRSLAVRGERRGKGHGQALVAAIESHAARRGVRTLYLLTTTAAPFFARLGYQPADRAAAPDAIRKTREFSQLCPSTAAFMAKALTPVVTSPKH